MKIPRTDLSIPDMFYNCPVCTKNKKGFWKLGSLVNHIKFKHPEHYIGKKVVLD